MEQKFGLPNSERDNPDNIEMAFVWTFHEIVEKLHQFAYISNDEERTKDFKYVLSTLQWQIDNYLMTVKRINKNDSR